jgi:dTMP kinase
MDEKIKIPQGFFVAIEGIDGTGKTTLSKTLGDAVSGYFEVYVTREPSDTEAGRKLRQSFINGRLSPLEEAKLFVEDRGFHIENEINPFTDQGYIVITDRYFFSNIAYQGAEGVSVEKLKEMNSRFPLPDMVLYINLDIDIALERIESSRGVANLMETREGINRVKNIYERLAEDYADIFVKIDGSLSLDEVKSSSLRYILSGLEKKITAKNDIKKFNQIKSHFFGE